MPNKQEEKEPKKEVLDLIGGSSKKKRAPQPAPAPAPSRPAPVKKEALDLLSGNKKKASRAADAAPAPAAAPAAAEPAAPAPQEEPSADDKIINLKPPVSVSELAGIKRTLAVRLGEGKARAMAQSFILAAYITLPTSSRALHLNLSHTWWMWIPSILFGGYLMLLIRKTPADSRMNRVLALSSLHLLLYLATYTILPTR